MPCCWAGKVRQQETASGEAFEKDSYRHFNPVLNTKRHADCDLPIKNLLTEMKNSSLKRKSRKLGVGNNGEFSKHIFVKVYPVQSLWWTFRCTGEEVTPLSPRPTPRIPLPTPQTCSILSFPSLDDSLLPWCSSQKPCLFPQYTSNLSGNPDGSPFKTPRIWLLLTLPVASILAEPASYPRSGAQPLPSQSVSIPTTRIILL